jgi:hypothetical protein
MLQFLARNPRVRADGPGMDEDLGPVTGFVEVYII